MMVSGRASARSATSSMRPRAAAASSRPSHTAWMRPRIPSTTRGVKALFTSVRSRVWSGGSRLSMCCVSGRVVRGTHGSLAVKSFESRSSLSSARTSA